MQEKAHTKHFQYNFGHYNHIEKVFIDMWIYLSEYIILMKKGYILSVVAPHIPLFRPQIKQSKPLSYRAGKQRGALKGFQPYKMTS